MTNNRNGELHEISLAIGRLEAQNQEALIQRREIWTQLNDINRQMMIVEGMTKRIDKVEHDVESWTDVRKKGTGALIVLGGISALLGAVGGIVKTIVVGR